MNAEYAIVIPLGKYSSMPQKQLLKLDGTTDATPPQDMDWRVEGDGWVASLTSRRSNIVIQGSRADVAKRAIYQPD